MSSLAAMHGWEWQNIQEAQSRLLRERVTEQSSEELEGYIEIFDSEIQAKDEQIQNLKQLLELSKAQSSQHSVDTSDLVPPELAKKIGRQLYDGEFSDRLRNFLILCQRGALDEVDNRTNELITRYLQDTEFTGRSVSLSSQIKSACRDGKQMPKQLGAIMQGLGFLKSQDGKHLKYSPPKDLFGLQTEILPSTPSDSQRGGKNRGAEVIRGFGIGDLKQ